MLRHLVKVALCFILISISPLNHFNHWASASSSTATINTTILNVREGPGLSYKVIKKVKMGEKFSITETKNDWYKLKLSNNLNGWVASWLVKTSEAATPQPTSSSSVTSTVDDLRIRTGPGTSFQITGFINKGQSATFIEKNENWTKIKLNNTVGWVSSQYLSASQATSPTPTETSSNTGKTGKITTNNLNVRSQPSQTASIIGKLNNGETVPVTNATGDWIEISYKNQKAFVHKDYINIAAAPSNNNTDSNTGNGLGTGIVTASTLNVRDQNTLSGKLVSTLKKGESVTILSESNKWYEIKLNNGTKGWVAGWFIERKESPVPPSSDHSEDSNVSTIKILHNGTNIRSSASTSTSVIARANEGDTFKILGTEGDWYKIEISTGKVGYIAGWIVQVIGDTPAVQKPGVNQYLKNKTIIIDPGHGGRDGGAVGVRGTYEKTLTLRTAKLVYDKLSAAGANVYLSRSSDTYVSLASRVSISHYRNADAFVSVHYDSINNSSVRGVTSYYYKNIDVPVASALQTEIIKYTGLKDRGHRSGNYQVLRSNRQPSVLLELGYLSNLSEELTINTSSYQEKVSSGIFYGLAQYFKAK
ncbi:SH3 domain-containing protein [Litchfieldia salsa]|uniref:N-acetylmuramoyl-L-alanine amidase n=1 Tax=Litchfieldia salsa TaxID=930152 RepID=A0A1H0V6H0_9BACI|nr:SH3 domain-containing protein [Litchfieldia salsa]SDP73865.1 N-acetylmuramoyl-L-alanine amidase [Litchfieldia salsa]